MFGVADLRVFTAFTTEAEMSQKGICQVKQANFRCASVLGLRLIFVALLEAVQTERKFVVCVCVVRIYARSWVRVLCAPNLVTGPNTAS